MTGSLQESESEQSTQSLSCGRRTRDPAHAARKEVTKDELQTKMLHEGSLLRLVRLCIRMCPLKGRMLQGQAFDSLNTRVRTQFNVIAMGCMQLG